MSIGKGTGSPGVFFKFALRFHLRRQLRERVSTRDQANAIREVLRDSTKFDDLAQTIYEYAQAEGQAELLAELDGTPAPAGPQRPIGRFLLWLWNNREQVLQFVLLIVGIFGGPSVTLSAGVGQETSVFAQSLDSGGADRLLKKADSGESPHRQKFRDIVHDLNVISEELETAKADIIKLADALA